ncbi:CPBP family intramembrane glutamic endopeptidase [Haloarcula halophila]|uniref:CPBP family intramembrane glutamic endopeptidase n=1 Tax=Haloarcula TaxID=2237 RepID=UPI0023E398CE|nr:CPBP family intramembrane glutamic endopeptidase [Halomicroarcula sp. DFY41]
MTDQPHVEAPGLGAIPPLTICCLALSLFGLPLLALLTETGGLSVSPLAQIALQWLVVALVVGVAVGYNGRSFAEIGCRRPGWLDVGYLLGTAVVALVVFVATDPLVAALGLPVESGAGAMSAGVGIGLALASAVTTGIVEEVLFRGYPIERLLAYTGSPLVAGGITWGAFTVGHAVVWPLGNLLQIAAVSAVLTVVYLRRRTLVPVTGAHVLVWVLAALGQVYG